MSAHKNTSSLHACVDLRRGSNTHQLLLLTNARENGSYFSIATDGLLTWSANWTHDVVSASQDGARREDPAQWSRRLKLHLEGIGTDESEMLALEEQNTMRLIIRRTGRIPLKYGEMKLSQHDIELDLFDTCCGLVNALARANKDSQARSDLLEKLQKQRDSDRRAVEFVRQDVADGRKLLIRQMARLEYIESPISSSSKSSRDAGSRTMQRARHELINVDGDGSEGGFPQTFGKRDESPKPDLSADEMSVQAESQLENSADSAVDDNDEEL